MAEEKVYLIGESKSRFEGMTKEDIENTSVGMKCENGGEVFNDCDSNYASGLNSHAEGTGNEAVGENSHVEGSDNKSNLNAANSHVEGVGNQSYAIGQHVGGKYAETYPSSSQFAEIIGNGTGTAARGNARTLDWNGVAWFAGKVMQDGTPTTPKDLTTKKYVDDLIEQLSQRIANLGG